MCCQICGKNLKFISVYPQTCSLCLEQRRAQTAEKYLREILGWADEDFDGKHDLDYLEQIVEENKVERSYDDDVNNLIDSARGK